MPEKAGVNTNYTNKSTRNTLIEDETIGENEGWDQEWN